MRRRRTLLVSTAAVCAALAAAALLRSGVSAPRTTDAARPPVADAGRAPGHAGAPRPRTTPSRAVGPRADESRNGSRAAEGCTLYTESFGSFAGPRDLDDGTHTVTWCTNGATVTGTSPCNAGGALRLSAAGHDPVIFVRLGGAPCSHVTLSFRYAQFAATDTTVRMWTTSAEAIQCQPAPSGPIDALHVTGGLCTTYTRTLLLNGATSFFIRIDHGSNANAILIDDLQIERFGCCTAPGDCCSTGGPGCQNAAVAACVCAIDPFCCRTAWDSICVALVESLGCGSCSPSCEGALAVDFGTVYQTGSLCSLFPAHFSACEGAAPTLTISGACAGSGDPAMKFGTGLPHSAAITRCIDLAGTAAPVLSFSWTKQSGTLGPAIAVSAGDGPFQSIWSAPVAYAGGCTTTSISLASWRDAGPLRLRFSSGSSIANGSGFDDIVIGDAPAGPHDCCTEGIPGCSDADVEACVCAIDPWCCEVEWDAICVAEAEYFGCADCGLCADAFTTGFGASFAPGPVCTVFPGLFASCEGTGPYLGLSGPCAGDNDPALIFMTGEVPSAAITRCLDLTGDDRARLRFVYSKPDGTRGPVVEASADLGSTWEIAWTAPESPGAGCHDACADLTPWTGLSFITLRLRAGGPSGGQMMDDLILERLPPAGDPARSPCARVGDLNGDDRVDFADLLILLARFGACPPIGGCPGDLDGNGRVDFADLLILLAAWT